MFVSKRICIFILCNMFIYFFCVQNTAYAVQEMCKDDARLHTLSELLETPNNITPPIVLTLESYVKLHSSIRKALAGNIVVCPKIPLNNQGEPVIHVNVDFYILIEKIKLCVAKEDWDEIAYMYKKFIANPLPAEGIVSLLVIPLYNDKNMKKFVKSLGIRSFTEKNETKFFLADIFRIFGGRVTQPVRMGVAHNRQDFLQAQAKMQSLKGDNTVVLYTGPYRQQAMESLKRCGVNVLSLENFFNP